MQKSENHQQATAVNRRKVQASTTLSRKYTKRPTKKSDVVVPVRRSPKIVRHFDSPMVGTTLKQQGTKQRIAEPADTIQPATTHPIQDSANKKMQERTARLQATSTQMNSTASRISAQELKEQAIKKALASASSMKPAENSTLVSEARPTKKKKTKEHIHFSMGRVMLALSCAAAAVFAIVYFVNLNMPDISLRVAAMQTGMDPTYPNYVPRDFSVSSITSEENEITIEFTNSSTNASYKLIEEESSWDTNALESNYIKPTYSENYTIMREQGLTIYISGSNAAWVSGGMVYKVNADNGVLTNKQIRAIATSL